MSRKKLRHIHATYPTPPQFLTIRKESISPSFPREVKVLDHISSTHLRGLLRGRRKKMTGGELENLCLVSFLCGGHVSFF